MFFRYWPYSPQRCVVTIMFSNLRRPQQTKGFTITTTSRCSKKTTSSTLFQSRLELPSKVARSWLILTTRPLSCGATTTRKSTTVHNGQLHLEHRGTWTISTRSTIRPLTNCSRSQAGSLMCSRVASCSKDVSPQTTSAWIISLDNSATTRYLLSLLLSPETTGSTLHPTVKWEVFSELATSEDILNTIVFGPTWSLRACNQHSRFHCSLMRLTGIGFLDTLIWLMTNLVPSWWSETITQLNSSTPITLQSSLQQRLTPTIGLSLCLNSRLATRTPLPMDLKLSTTRTWPSNTTTKPWLR